jgi:hypothetical protein
MRRPIMAAHPQHDPSPPTNQGVGEGHTEGHAGASAVSESSSNNDSTCPPDNTNIADLQNR